MQLLICLISAWIYLTMNHLWLLAALFFVAMQVSSVFGAMWATRLKRKFSGGADSFSPPLNQQVR